MKTFEQLSKDVVKVVEDRIKAESPAIQDTPRRRFTVFQSELRALLATESVSATPEEIDDAAQEFAFGLPKIEETTEVPLVEPAKADDIIKKFAKTDAN